MSQAFALLELGWVLIYSHGVLECLKSSFLKPVSSAFSNNFKAEGLLTATTSEDDPSAEASWLHPTHIKEEKRQSCFMAGGSCWSLWMGSSNA